MSILGSKSREHSFLKLEMHSSIRPAYAPKNSCTVDKSDFNHNFCQHIIQCIYTILFNSIINTDKFHTEHTSQSLDQFLLSYNDAPRQVAADNILQLEAARESLMGSYLQDMTETMCGITVSELYTIINCLKKIK